ncbi:hypothetical protein EVAR_39943_1 [Eumeta japonica]|uniref:Uncharacterized protein n=1 Tax=Eumeta variegata TaxID=151549 RepID=A0A4C1X4Q3_EUMVA|nr:hypothetical protein EVAR_39943_1 [Eumeta japonica]
MANKDQNWHQDRYWSSGTETEPVNGSEIDIDDRSVTPRVELSTADEGKFETGDDQLDVTTWDGLPTSGLKTWPGLQTKGVTIGGKWSKIEPPGNLIVLSVALDVQYQQPRPDRCRPLEPRPCRPHTPTSHCQESHRKQSRFCRLVKHNITANDRVAGSRPVRVARHQISCFHTPPA